MSTIYGTIAPPTPEDAAIAAAQSQVTWTAGMASYAQATGPWANLATIFAGGTVSVARGVSCIIDACIDIGERSSSITDPIAY